MCSGRNPTALAGAGAPMSPLGAATVAREAGQRPSVLSPPRRPHQMRVAPAPLLIAQRQANTVYEFASDVIPAGQPPLSLYQRKLVGSLPWVIPTVVVYR